jgi:formylglycine-generating enzyme required for sulfatase activity
MRQIGPTGGEGFHDGLAVQRSTAATARGRRTAHKVTLTKAFYAGVYEVTQSQWQQVMGDVRSWPAKWSNNDYRLTRPVEQVSYYDIREDINNTDDAAVDWPANDAVTAGSFMGRLRTKTGLAGFDLPTDAQWEYACRAGTTGALNDGTVNITNDEFRRAARPAGALPVQRRKNQWHDRPRDGLHHGERHGGGRLLRAERVGPV